MPQGSFSFPLRFGEVDGLARTEGFFSSSEGRLLFPLGSFSGPHSRYQPAANRLHGARFRQQAKLLTSLRGLWGRLV
jgi:hypothetical protein